MNLLDFIIFDFICFILKVMIILIALKIYKKKKKSDFETSFNFGDSTDKSILDINVDDLDNQDIDEM